MLVGELIPAAEHSYRGLVNRIFLCSLFTFLKRTHAFGVGIDVSLNGITRISSRRIVHNRPRIRFDFSLAGPAPRRNSRFSTEGGYSSSRRPTVYRQSMSSTTSRA